MVANFLAGGAAVSVFCRRHGLRLRVVDAGTAQPPAPHPDLIDARVGAGTADILEADAMTQEQLDRCFAHGRRVVAEHVPPGGNVLALGEMGIGNSGAAALLTAGLTGAPLDRCIGPGTGLAGEGLVRKRRLLAQAAQARGGLGGIDPRRLLQRFGGFEIAQMTAAFLEGGRRGMLLLVDGFIAAAAFLAAERLAPGLRRRAVFCHASAEPGARLLLHALEAEPLLDLGLRLGEGSGCALAFPLVQSAADFLTDMAAFEEAGIDRLDPHR
jgi:nicotinate-nucleotide--dimethylbenzimidazole phosphoribosyltransferase